MASIKIQFHSQFNDDWKKILAKLPDGKPSNNIIANKIKTPTKADYKKALRDLTYNIANNRPIKGKELIQSTKDNIRAYKCPFLGNQTDDVRIAWCYYKGTYNKISNQTIALILRIGGHEIINKIKDMKNKLYEQKSNSKDEYISSSYKYPYFKTDNLLEDFKDFLEENYGSRDIFPKETSKIEEIQTVSTKYTNKEIIKYMMNDFTGEMNFPH